MLFESKAKITFISISFLLASTLFTACTADNTITTQAAMNEQEVAISKSSDILNEKTPNQMEAIKDKKFEKVITSWEDYEASSLPLLSALPDKDIYLYDTKTDQVVLNVGGNKHYYNWLCLTPRFILPRMKVSDFDADGKDELSVILYVGSGTGVSVEDLHIVEVSEDQTLSGKQSGNTNPEYFKDHIYSSEDYISQLHKAVGFKTFVKAGQLMGKITTDNKTHTVSFKDFKPEECGKISDDPIFGSIVHFYSENNKLRAEFGFGIAYANFASPQYIGTLYTDVGYKAGKFQLKNFRFEENME